MKKVIDTTQKLLTLFIVLLSVFAVYKGRTDVAIYLMLVALYTRNTIDVTVIMPKEDEKEAEE